MSVEQANQHKAEGNKAFSAGNFQEAITHFTKAIECNPNDHVFYSNRSACYASLGKYNEALQDAKKCVELKPDWAKGYGRKGLAEFYLQQLDDAEVSYRKGLELEPTNEQCKEGLKRVQEARNTASTSTDADTEELLNKLRNNPKTAEYVKDPGFVKKIAMLAEKPDMIFTLIQADPRLQDAFEVIFSELQQGVGSGFSGSNLSKPTDDRHAQKSEGKANGQNSSNKMEEEKKANSQHSKQSDPFEDAKNAGNEAYRKRDFQTALSYYDKALELNPNEYLIYNNKAAVYLEMKDFEKAQEMVDKALEVYKEQKPDFVKLAKMYHRKANIYLASEDYDNAIEYYKKSLLEDNNQKVKDDLKKAEKEKKLFEERRYINPELAEKHKEQGNQLFKKGDFPGALKEYDEAIRRNPNDAKLYSNKATSYMKLLEFPSALKMIDKALELDPQFVKGWAKKGVIHEGMKEYHRALEAFEKGLKIDPISEECKQGRDSVRMKILIGTGTKEDDEERFRHAMADPEIQRILADPTIQNVISELQERPTDPSVRKALRDPTISAKLEKLIAAGVIKTG